MGRGNRVTGASSSNANVARNLSSVGNWVSMRMLILTCHTDKISMNRIDRWILPVAFFLLLLTKSLYAEHPNIIVIYTDDRSLRQAVE